MTSDILKRAAEVSARARVYSIIAGDMAINLGELLTDMAAAIAERDVENARLTARAEAAEAMADRLAEAMNDIRDYATILASDGQHRVLREVLAAHAAMKEGR